MATVNCRELAESYINGNISWVRGVLKRESKISLRTAQIILEDYGQEEYDTFVKLMIS